VAILTPAHNSSLADHINDRIFRFAWIQFVHNHPSGKMHMLKLSTPRRDISESISA
jgi:hypothetical protein